jgi:lipoyl(octanoyl) transferase
MLEVAKPGIGTSADAARKSACATLNIRDLGCVRYAEALAIQQELVEKRKHRQIPDQLLFVEHPHVITQGRNGHAENLLAGEDALRSAGIEYFPTNRGGDITYHGPGQIVGYPILDLAQHRRDIRWYVEQLEELMIRSTTDFGLAAHRSEANHGVWLNAPAGEEKLAALGVHLSRWVSSHGFAYNVATDLRYFDLIVPCGVAGKRATSLERALGRAVAIGEVRERLVAHFASVFACETLRMTRKELDERLHAARAIHQHAASALI